jgi:hypothetical protein
LNRCSSWTSRFRVRIRLEPERLVLAQREEFGYPEEYGLPDVLAMVLATQARRAFFSGLLHGYQPEEQAC